MKIKIFEFNPLGVHTYVLHDDTNECVIIDPACYFPDEKQLLLDYILDNNLMVKAVVNTHLHFDHIYGVNFVEAQFGVDMACHPDDLFLIDPAENSINIQALGAAASSFLPRVSKTLHEGDVVKFGKQQLNIFHIPGHSPGSIVLYHEPSASVFVGDVLFRESIGRTDLLKGNFQDLIDGIKQKLFVLPNETTVYPGHGPSTTIGFEKTNNPFLS